MTINNDPCRWNLSNNIYLSDRSLSLGKLLWFILLWQHDDRIIEIYNGCLFAYVRFLTQMPPRLHISLSVSSLFCWVNMTTLSSLCHLHSVPSADSRPITCSLLMCLLVHHNSCFHSFFYAIVLACVFSPFTSSPNDIVSEPAVFLYPSLTIYRWAAAGHTLHWRQTRFHTF